MMRSITDDHSNETPPYSRLFVVCSKQLTKDDLTPVFEKFGTIERIYLPKDRQSGESKGIAYIKYAQTSSAAAAIEALHMKTLDSCDKPLKVMISSNSPKCQDNNIEDAKYRRLFIKVDKDTNEEAINQHFSQFGKVCNVYLQKDKATGECRGFAYVMFNTFKEAATAIEKCDKKYKAIFALPKDELKRGRNNYDSMEGSYSSYSNTWRDNFIPDSHPPPHNVDMFNKKDMGNGGPPPLMNNKTIHITCNPCLPQRYIERLFNAVPGMINFKYTVDSYNLVCKAIVTYDNPTSAAHAIDVLNNFEFPSGETITVRPNDPISAVAKSLTQMVNTCKSSLDSPNLMQLADAIEQASSLIKAATSKDLHLTDSICSVPLPPPQPPADRNAKVAQRCFVVFKPAPPSLPILRDVFSRFGDLIDVTVYPRKTFGFVRYASSRAAQEAMSTLHGAYVCDVHLKVMEATEKENTDQDTDMESKRPKLND